MINYKLAKKLKDVGFPQKNPLIKLLTNAKSRYSEMRLKRLWYGIDGFYRYSDEAEFEDWIIIPTLEELIEACGDNISSLQKTLGADKWYANSFGRVEEPCEGKTLLEAVAKLWIKLSE